jgi:peptide deformylase
MPIDELIRLGRPRPIVRWGSDVLHAPTRPVTDFGGELQELLADLFATNTAARGAGLAAPQVGVDLAVFVYDCLDAELRRHRGVICNPELELPVGDGRRLVALEEGCLSLPGAFALVDRPDRATCRGRDQAGAEVEVAGSGTLARCLQHETDHLHGRVFGDRLANRARRELYRRHDAVADEYPDDWPVTPRATR